MTNCPCVQDAADQIAQIKALKARPDIVKTVAAMAVRGGMFQAQVIGYKKSGACLVLPLTNWVPMTLAAAMRNAAQGILCAC